MDQTFSGEGLISNVAGINVKIFKIDKIKISVKTPSRARTLKQLNLFALIKNAS